MHKILGIISLIAFAFTAHADEPAYSLVNDEQGYSYIQINQDLDSFSFTSDFKSIGNSGKVGYFVYPNGLEGDALKTYISSVAPYAKFGKDVDGGLVKIEATKAGDRVGFYLQRNNGDIVRGWDFQTKDGTTYIAFDKNGGHGKDEWMSIRDISVVMAQHDQPPVGQPLPGFTFVLIFGGVLLLAIGMRRRMATTQA